MCVHARLRANTGCLCTGTNQSTTWETFHKRREGQRPFSHPGPWSMASPSRAGRRSGEGKMSVRGTGRVSSVLKFYSASKGDRQTPPPPVVTATAGRMTATPAGSLGWRAAVRGPGGQSQRCSRPPREAGASLLRLQGKQRAQDSDHDRLVDPTRGREPPIPVPLLLIVTPVPSPGVGPATRTQRTTSPGTQLGPPPHFAPVNVQPWGFPSWPSLYT